MGELGCPILTGGKRACALLTVCRVGKLIRIMLTEVSLILAGTSLLLKFSLVVLVVTGATL